MTESQTSSRPSRAIKRRRFSDDTYDQVPNMEAVFRNREIQDSVSASPSKTTDHSKQDEQNGDDNSVSPQGGATVFLTASVNVPTSSKRLKSTSKRLKSRAQFMNT